MKSVIKSFSEHGTFVQPDTLNYILSKDDPKEFTSFLTKKLKEYPLVLTIEQVKNIEQETKIKDIPKPCENSLEKKELQKKILSAMYGGVLQPETSFEENELEYDDPDKDDQIFIPDENIEEETIPQLIEIKKVKGWKPASLDYESEIEIIKDITGKSTCEGTTSDFTKLFLNK